jgi:hypothetical protein
MMNGASLAYRQQIPSEFQQQKSARRSLDNGLRHSALDYHNIHISSFHLHVTFVFMVYSQGKTNTHQTTKEHCNERDMDKNQRLGNFSFRTAGLGQNVGFGDFGGSAAARGVRRGDDADAGRQTLHDPQIG